MLNQRISLLNLIRKIDMKAMHIKYKYRVLLKKDICNINREIINYNIIEWNAYTCRRYRFTNRNICLGTKNIFANEIYHLPIYEAYISNAYIVNISMQEWKKIKTEKFSNYNAIIRPLSNDCKYKYKYEAINKCYFQTDTPNNNNCLSVCNVDLLYILFKGRIP